jgi:tRNA-2-methylthio-N6-dimethylallyladenosine synthase
LERVRFTSPHPAAFTEDVIDAMAETPNVCHQLHMPLQSGSDRLLKEMKRSYRSARYLSILDRVRAVMPDAAITTDIIVGFPGETEEDFEATLDVVRQARFSNAFTFQYSKRPGTPAAEMAGQLPKAVVQERYERLVQLQDDIAWQENKQLVGHETHRMSGRARDGRLVHFTPAGSVVDRSVRPGDIVQTVVTYGAPHHLVSDGELISHRRTRAGDNVEAGHRPKTNGVGLGLPSFGAPPVPVVATGGCAP